MGVIMAEMHLALGAALNIYILDAQSRNYSPKTLEFYRGRVGRFLEWLERQGINTVRGVEAGHIRAYLAERAGLLSATTVHTEARAIRAFLNFCVREGWIEHSPLRVGMMPRRPRLIRPALTEAQVRSLLKRSSPQEAAIILVLLDTGLRAAEFCKLNVPDIDLAAGTVTVRQGKGAKDRQAYLGARSRKALLRYWGEMGLADGPAVLTQRGRKRLTPNSLNRTLTRVGALAGVDVSPHALRRTFAVLNLRAGIDVYTLARLMGHESIETLRQYLPLVDDDIRSAHQRVGIVDRL